MEKWKEYLLDLCFYHLQNVVNTHDDVLLVQNPFFLLHLSIHFVIPFPLEICEKKAPCPFWCCCSNLEHGKYSHLSEPSFLSKQLHHK